MTILCNLLGIQGILTPIIHFIYVKLFKKAREPGTIPDRVAIGFREPKQRGKNHQVTYNYSHGCQTDRRIAIYAYISLSTNQLYKS